MPAETRCPECPSENVIFSKKRGVYVCEDCGHEFTPDKPFVPQRIFLSYGHDEHVSLAIHLRDDLRDRKHTVWFDEERLQPGHDWEAFIEKGLEHLAADKANAAVILLLTPHSVRRPDGYCLNEVARALGRGLRIIPLMVVESEPPLSICRIQWLDMRQCLPIHEKQAFYRPRFERLLKALEENQLDFEGTQQRLLKALQPLEFDADILRHLPKFTGRQWVFDAIDQWLAENPPKQRVFWISGGPGVGKTAISAVLSSRYLEVGALHLCKFGHAQKSDPRSVVTSVVYQLTTQLPEYEARLASMDVEKLAQDDARTMFDNLLVQPLAKLTPPKRSIVILIDALDEATRDGRNELASFIAQEFPKTPTWLRLIITSRPEAEVTGPLQGMNPFILDTDIESNRADIRAYLRRELASHLQNRPDAEHLIAQIVAKSEGLFLYVERVCDDIHHGNLSLDHLDQFPQGLGGVYWQFFERKFPNQARFKKEIRPALRAILAAREPLPVEILQQLFNWQDEDLRDFTRTLGSLFPVTKEANGKVIKPYHKSLADWLTEEGKAAAYFVSTMEGQRMLADFGWDQYRQGANCISAYILHHTASHLAATKRLNELRIMLSDLKFIETKCVAGMTYGLVDDYACAIQTEKCDTDFASSIKEWAEFVRAHAHLFSSYAASVRSVIWQQAMNATSGSGVHRAATATPRPLGYTFSPSRDATEAQALPLTLYGHKKSIGCLVFSADGSRILTSSWDGTVRLWDANTGKTVAILEGHTAGVESCCFSPCGNYILSTSFDQTARLWDTNSRQTRLVLKGHNHRVTWGAFSCSGRLLATCSADRTLKIWATANGANLRTIELGDDWRRYPRCCGFVGDDLVFVEFDGGNPMIFAAEGEPNASATEMRKAFWSHAEHLSSAGKAFACFLRPKTIRVFAGDGGFSEVSIPEAVLSIRAYTDSEWFVTTPARFLCLRAADSQIAKDVPWVNSQKNCHYAQPRVFTNGKVVAEVDYGSCLVWVWSLPHFLSRDEKTRRMPVVGLAPFGTHHVLAFHEQLDMAFSTWDLVSGECLTEFTPPEGWDANQYAIVGSVLYLTGDYQRTPQDVVVAHSYDLSTGKKIDGSIGRGEDFDNRTFFDVPASEWKAPAKESRSGDHSFLEARLRDGILEVWDKRTQAAVAVWGHPRAAFSSCCGVVGRDQVVVGAYDGSVFCLRLNATGVGVTA